MTMQVSIDGWMGKQNVFTDNTILSSLKKDRAFKTYFNMEEPQGHPAKWKKSDTKTTDCMIPLTQNVQKRRDGMF